MLFLCLAILSSSAISLLMRISAGKTSAKLSMLGCNYLVCALLGAVYAGAAEFIFDHAGTNILFFQPSDIPGQKCGFARAEKAGHNVEMRHLSYLP